MAILPPTPNKNRQLRRYALASAETPVDGGVVLLVAGEVTVAGVNPALILGFAVARDPTAMTFDPYGGDVMVWVAYPGSTFWMKGTSNPVAANIGVAFGINSDQVEVAQVDITDVTTTRLLVEDIDTDWNMFEVSVLAANRQLQA